jgi:hypothetical protein
LYNDHNELTVRHGNGDAAIELRFDGNTGKFKYGNDLYITEANEEFTFNPVAFRAFWGRPFEAYQNEEVWIEMFGITQAKCTFRLLLRGSSATELNKFAFFLNIRPTDTLLTLKPMMRVNKTFSKTYFILSPEFKEVHKADKATMDDLKAYLYIYSSNLIHLDFNGKPFTTIIAENYCNEDYINPSAFQLLQTVVEKPSMLSIVAPNLKVVDEELLTLPANQKGVKKAA